VGTEVAAAVVALVATASALASVLREQARRAEAERRLSVLSSLTDPALAAMDPAHLFDELLRRARTALAVERSCLHLLDAGGIVLRATDGAGPEPPLALVRRVAAEADHVLHNGSEGGCSFFGCPVIVDGEVVGVVSLTSSAADVFTTSDLRVGRQIAFRFGWVLEREAFGRSEAAVQEALEESEHRVRTLLEAAPVGVVETNRSRQVVRWNRVAADLLGWPRWLTGMSNPGALPEETTAALRSALEGQRTSGVIVPVHRSGVRSLQVQASAAPLTDREGNVDGVLLLLDDVTDRLQLEQHVRQGQRLEALARLAGVVAHDFNNLLTVIRGYGEVLLKSLPSGDSRRADVDAILEAGDRATELTKQLLAVGRRPLQEPEPLDVHDHVRQLAGVLHRLVGRDVELRVVTGPAPSPVRVDGGDLDQTVINLVNNARDALDGRGRIMVETRAIELGPRGASLAGVTAGRYVMVTVADTGPGMPPDVVEHCFDPFFTTKGRGKGTGLGLAAVYGTATQAGGHATVESVVGRGTTVRVWLPVDDAAGVSASRPATTRPQAVRRSRNASGRDQGRGHRILLVEDEAPLRALARASLEEAGHEVLEAGSAEEALRRLSVERLPVALLLSDVVLGGMPGDELATVVRRRQPRTKVVLMSGFTERALQADPDAFVAKPFAFEDLVAVVGQVLSDPADARPTARSGSRPRGRSAPTGA
jgi:two-component system, cell cycle sensor histidine kinase and response regulator CckA